MQVNMRAGSLAPADEHCVDYLKVSVKLTT
jgi:hypothetical protein